MQTNLPVAIGVKQYLNTTEAAKSPNQPGKSTYEQKARAAAEEFEATFLTTYIGQMFSGLKTDGPFGGGYGEKVYRDMMTEQYAKHTAASGGIGIADQVYTEILRMQEANNQ